MEVTLRTCQSVPFYACGGFDPSVCAHGFSTRLGGVSPAPWDSLNLGAARGDAPEHVAENFRREKNSLQIPFRTVNRKRSYFYNPSKNLRRETS